MFFFLSKALHILTEPIFWILFLWSIYAWKKKSKWRKKLLLSAVVISFLFTNTLVFKEVARLWEVHGVDANSIENYDVAIVLGGMFEYNNDLKTLSARRGADRLYQALRLYHRGKVKKLLISGSNGFVSDRGLDEAKQIRDELVIWGIPREDILIDSLSKNTWENASNTFEILQRNGLTDKRLLIITSGTHMRRSLGCFEKLGLRVDSYSTDLFTGPKRSYHWDEYIIPSLSTADDWSILTHEIAGYLVYKIMGYL